MQPTPPPGRPARLSTLRPVPVPLSYSQSNTPNVYHHQQALPVSAPTTPSHPMNGRTLAVAEARRVQSQSSSPGHSPNHPQRILVRSQPPPPLQPPSQPQTVFLPSPPRSLLVDHTNNHNVNHSEYIESGASTPAHSHSHSIPVSATRLRSNIDRRTSQTTTAADTNTDTDSDGDDKYSKHRHRRITSTTATFSLSSLLSPSFYASLSTPVWVMLVAVACVVTMSLSFYWFAASFTLDNIQLPLKYRTDRPRPRPPSLTTIIGSDDQFTVDEEWVRQICGDEPKGTVIKGINCPGPEYDTRFGDSDANGDALSAPTTRFTVDDITIFTVFSPEPEEKPLLSKKGKLLKPMLPHDNTSWLRSIYSWNQRVAIPSHIMVLVKQVEDCSLLIDLPFELYCRVASACWDSNQPITSSSDKHTMDAPYLKCILNEANQRSETALMVFVEDHIVLFKDFVPAILNVANRLDFFFAVGSSTSLTLTVDPNLSLVEWQKDIQNALFSDSSMNDADRDRESEHARHAEIEHAHALHYFAYPKHHLDLSTLSSSILMGGGQFYGHQWEKILVAYLLLQDNLTLVDVTDAVTAIELTHRDPSNHTININEFNAVSTINSTAIPHLSLGRLENSHYVMIGKCPTCSLKENREADLPLILIRHANQYHQIIVITVNSDYLSLAFNWICRARALNIHNYVMLAEDRVAYRIMRKMDVPVVLRKDAPYKKVAAATGSAEFQETLYLRALFFKEVVSLGFDLILSHLDTIWFESPMTLFNTRTECDMYVSMEGGSKAGGGLLFVRSTALGQQFVKDYLICEQENWEFITVHGKSRFYYSDDPDMNCVDLISQRLVRRNHLRRCVLDPLRYVSEVTFFDRQLPQYKSIYPSFVHINEAEGVRNKTKVFLDWDLWQVDDLAMINIAALREIHHHGSIQCKPQPPALPTPDYELWKKMKIVVNVLASTEHFALSQTLEHLAAAQYDPSIKVDIRISVQQPEHESASTNKQYMRVVNLAKEFKWLHGTKTIIYLDGHVGPTDQWLDHWTLDDHDNNDNDNQLFQLALLAGQSLSREWFFWCKKSLQNYYYHPYQHDPQLMAIHLMHQFTIVGESPTHRFGSRVPSTVLNSSATLYHYQLVPLLGTLFFPQHFETFLHWYSAQNHSQPSKVPCVPTLISNRWYQNEPVKHWWTWLTRFAFESGWYALHTNFLSVADRKPRALLIDETPLAGQLTVSLVRTLATRESVMPSITTIPLYDLHFNSFGFDRSMLSIRKTLFPPMPAQRRENKAALDQLKIQQAEIENERAQWKRERGGGGRELIEEDDDSGAQSLWSRVHNKRQAAILARLIAETQVDEREAEEQLTIDGEPRNAKHDNFVTTTDLIIDLMKTIMSENEESDDATSLSLSQSVSSVSDSERYKSELARIKQKIKHVRAGEQHIHHHVRGSHHDRCFIVGDASQNEDDSISVSASHALALSVDSLPYPYNASLSLVELYQYIYRTNYARLPTKPGARVTNGTVNFIVYRPKIPVPFDRHLRGIYFTFLTALVTERIFLVDLPDFEAMYDVPIPGIKWQYKQFERYFVNNSGLLISEIDDRKLKEQLRTNLFNTIFKENVLFHSDAVSHDRLMFTNVQYKPYALSLFSTLSRMRRVGIIMKLLQSKPKNALIATGKDLFKTLGLTSVKYSLCVHVVSPPPKLAKSGSVDYPLPDVGIEHWNCIQSLLLSLGFKDVDSVIFFTTNSPYIASHTVAKNEIEKYGRVVINDRVFESNLTSYGVGNATMIASTHHDSLSNALIYDPYIVNHFIFGDCDVSVSSGTTYGIFGAARTGFNKRAFLYKAAPPPTKDKDGKWVHSEEKDYCGPMHRIDYPKDNDIHF